MLKSYFKSRSMIAIAICLAAVTVFSSCETNTSKSIIGAWVFEKAEIKELSLKENAEMSREEFEYEFIPEEDPENEDILIWDFQSSGKVTFSHPNSYYLGSPISFDFDYSIIGNTLTITDDEDLLYSGKYSISGNNLYFDIDLLSNEDDREIFTEIYGITKAIITYTFNKK